MTPYRSLLAAALQSRDAYELIRISEEAEHFKDMLEPAYAAVASFYEADPAAKSADAALLVAGLTTSVRNPKHRKAIATILQECAEANVSQENIRRYLEAAARERVGDALSAALATRRPAADVAALIEQYTNLGDIYGEKESDEIDFADLIARRADPRGRIVVTPRSLNERLGGGVLPGHNLTIFGRPESGKSALAISMACGFARRRARVLYAGNEDPVDDIALRAVCCLSGRTASEAAADPEGTAALARSAGGARLIFRDIAPGTLGELERLVRSHKPDVLILDQLRNIGTGRRDGRGDNYTQHLDAVAQGLRAIGKRYQIVTIGVTQAGDSARGKPVLDMGDVDSSNTGIPGAADVLIGVGVTDMLEGAGSRMLSLCKNKLTGRHEHFTVRIDPSRSTIRSE